jgi:uncharacterized protein YjbI with pentapeptide repeats
MHRGFSGGRIFEDFENEDFENEDFENEDFENEDFENVGKRLRPLHEPPPRRLHLSPRRLTASAKAALR